MSELEQRAKKDAPLRYDIRTLGDALGRAILQHGGTRVFDTEERLRLSCKRLRECAERLALSSIIASAGAMSMKQPKTPSLNVAHLLPWSSFSSIMA